MQALCLESCALGSFASCVLDRCNVKLVTILYLSALICLLYLLCWDLRKAEIEGR